MLGKLLAKLCTLIKTAYRNEVKIAPVNFHEMFLKIKKSQIEGEMWTIEIKFSKKKNDN